MLTMRVSVGTRRELMTDGRESASIPVLFAALASLVTVMSQIAAVDLTVVFGALWLLVAVFVFRRKGQEVLIGGFPLLLLVCFLAFGGFAFLGFLSSGEMGYITGFFMLLAKVVLVYFVGVAMACVGSRATDFKGLFLLYVVAAVLYALWVQVTYIPSFSAWLQSEEYLFESKNSFGQIAGIAAICTLFAPTAKRLVRVAKIPVIAYLVYMIAMAQCRTALVACLVGILAYLIYRRKWRVLLCAFLVAGLLILFVPEVQTFVSHAFLTDKYEGATLDAMSSGRLVLWEEALESFAKAPLLGDGVHYVDNLYINLLANVGVVGFAFLAGLFVVRLVYNRAHLARRESEGTWEAALQNIVVCASLFYLVESMLEGYPPYGPGTCAFMFWIVCGYLDEQALLRGRRTNKPMRVLPFGRVE